MAARDDTFRAPAQPDHRRAGHPAALLAAHRIRTGGKFPRGGGRRRIHALLLSRHGGAHPSFHRDLFHGVGHRGPARRFLAGCAGCAGLPRVDRLRQMPRGYDTCGGAGCLVLSGSPVGGFAARWCGGRAPAGCPVARRFRADRFGICHRLAPRIDPRLPCHDELGAYSALVAFGCLFSGAGRHVDGVGGSSESAGLCHGECAAGILW